MIFASTCFSPPLSPIVNGCPLTICSKIYFQDYATYFQHLHVSTEHEISFGILSHKSLRSSTVAVKPYFTRKGAYNFTVMQKYYTISFFSFIKCTMFDTYYEFLWLFNEDCKNDSRLVAIDNRSLTDDWLEMDHRPLAENETKVSKISRIPISNSNY